MVGELEKRLVQGLPKLSFAVDLALLEQKHRAHLAVSINKIVGWYTCRRFVILLMVPDTGSKTRPNNYVQARHHCGPSHDIRSPLHVLYPRLIVHQCYISVAKCSNSTTTAHAATQ